MEKPCIDGRNKNWSQFFLNRIFYFINRISLNLLSKFNCWIYHQISNPQWYTQRKVFFLVSISPKAFYKMKCYLPTIRTRIWRFFIVLWRSERARNDLYNPEFITLIITSFRACFDHHRTMKNRQIRILVLIQNFGWIQKWHLKQCTLFSLAWLVFVET